ncbi:MAG TPA: cation:proton antiporter [Blastocatellia bacterium]|nr:cation:proton antiporter [Blastocatellia bacterium]
MNKRILLALTLTVTATWLIRQTVSANSGGEAGASEGAGHGLDPFVLIGVAVILIVAKLGGELFERFKQAAVLGELIGGIIVGNLALAGFTAVERLKTNEVIGALAEIGVIILLFEAGLESNLIGMMEVGWSSLLVAVAGVAAPFFLGWGVAAYFMPGESSLAHIFIGATLCATSVGITARVLKDMRLLQTREARVILGAAVIDDVLGLLILAIVVGAIKAATAGTALSASGVVVIAVKAVLFLVVAIVAGHYVVPRLFRRVGRLESRGVLLALAIAFCFLLAWLASQVGLAPIVGAFAAGLVLDEAYFKSFRDRGEHRLDELLQPVGAVLIPIFFVWTGLKVDLNAFARPDLLGFATFLTFAAIVGKQVCSLAVIERPINRPAIGLGMIPRGEVGLIFAGIGATLMMPNAQGVSEPVVGTATFGAVIIMVIITTLVTPPLLKWSLDRAPSVRSHPNPKS